MVDLVSRVELSVSFDILVWTVARDGILSSKAYYYFLIGSEIWQKWKYVIWAKYLPLSRSVLC